MARHTIPRARLRSPGSRTRDVHTCSGSKDDAGWPRSSRCPLLATTASAPRTTLLSPPHTSPIRPPINASCTTHGSNPRTTRGQGGSLLLACNGPSPTTSCRSSPAHRGSITNSRNCCVRFVAGVTVGSRNTCYRAARCGLTEASLPPAGLHQLSLAPSSQ